jgi:hypothetical protein
MDLTYGMRLESRRSTTMLLSGSAITKRNKPEIDPVYVEGTQHDPIEDCG